LKKPTDNQDKFKVREHSDIDREELDFVAKNGYYVQIIQRARLRNRWLGWHHTMTRRQR
jgi:hypothetical protein